MIVSNQLQFIGKSVFFLYLYIYIYIRCNDFLYHINSLLEELIRRDGLKIALSGRDEFTLEPFLSYLIKYISQPRYTKILIDVSNVLLDIYASILGQSVIIDELFTKLRHRLLSEIQFQKDLMSLLGSVHVIISNNASAIS